jgi:chromodomain-helicase-DNA-binding protein 1
VEKSLPPKNERILRVDMTPLQKQYYKVALGGDRQRTATSPTAACPAHLTPVCCSTCLQWVLSRNFRELNKGLKGGGQVSLLNVLMELKKVGEGLPAAGWALRGS